MPEKITLVRPGQARIEFRAVQEVVKEKLAAGYTQTMIYEELSAAGRLTVSYSAFCDYVRGGGQRLHRRRQKSRFAPQANRSNIFKPAAKSEPFSTVRPENIEDLA
ncbi:hypothetical protein FACS189460_0550 [Deltaproteobacteria bacterium]|nr:hypothetical protein FACS189460_0550 [Deltaproteobacteria bacterium]